MFLSLRSVLAYGILRVIQLDLIIYELFVVGPLKRKQLEVKIERRHRRPDGLVIYEVQVFHIWMGQCLLHCNPLLRVKDQHL